MASSSYVVAAMCGCFKRESGVNPGVWESLTPTTWDHEYQYDNIGGFGLGQWTNVGTPYGRCWQLHEWVTANGYADGDGNGQMAFIIHEDVWYNSAQQRGSYTTLTEFLESDSTNLEDLTWDWLASWEGVPGDAFAERLEAATRFFNYINDHQNDDPEDYEWISGNFYSNWEQMYNNVMCIYFWLDGYAPTPTPTGKKKGMPLWMMLKRMRYI